MRLSIALPLDVFRYAAVERDQQVEALLLAHLTDDEPVGPHPQGFLDQPAQGDLAGALQVRLPGLHGHRVGQRQLKFEDLLDRDDPFGCRDGRAQSVEQSGLAGLGAAGDQDVQPGGHRGLQESGGLLGQGAQPDEFGQSRHGDDELADVDGQMPPGDARDHHMQSRAIGKLGVHERLAQVQPAAGQPQHPFDQVGNLLGGQDDRGQLRASTPGDEDPAGLVDPDLLDLPVVEELLQLAEASDLVEHRAGRLPWIGQRRQGGNRCPVKVIGHHLLDQPAGGVRFQHRIERAATDEFAHLVLDDRHAS